jgi:hypothetical protein
MKRKSTASDKKTKAVLSQSLSDFKTAALLVSVTINLFLLCLWIALQVTADYDHSLFSFFINR